LSALGLKYLIHKAANGEPLDGPAFVLRYDRDRHARRALADYARSIWDEDRELASDLMAEVILYEKAAYQHKAKPNG
jgi:hypothetical protein